MRIRDNQFEAHCPVFMSLVTEIYTVLLGIHGSCCLMKKGDDVVDDICRALSSQSQTQFIHDSIWQH